MTILFRHFSRSHIQSNRRQYSHSHSLDSLFPRPPMKCQYPRGEPFIRESIVEVQEVPRLCFYLHKGQNIAVPESPNSGCCVYHLVPIPRFSVNYRTQVNGIDVIFPGLLTESTLLLGVEVENNDYIPIAVAEKW